MTTTTLLQRKPELILTYAAGSHSSTSSRWGLRTLVMRGDGALELDSRWYTKRRTFQGRVSPAVVERVLALLEAGNFPTTPAHRIPPGSSLRTVHVKNGALEGYTLPIDWHVGAEMAEYKDAFKLLDSIARQVTVDEIQATPDFEPGLVEGASKLTDVIEPPT